MQKLFSGIGMVMIISVCGSLFLLRCSVYNNYISEENYARMAQEIIDPSILQETKACRGR